MGDAGPQIPPESPSEANMVFQVLKSFPGSRVARLGRLSLPHRKAIDTPNFIGVSSRGCIPHVTPDNLSKHTELGAAYMALEDFIEKKEPAIFKYPKSPSVRPLNDFSALPEDVATILAPRRIGAVVTPEGNGADFIYLWTSAGGNKFKIERFYSAIESMRPDVAILPADLFHTSSTPVAKKLLRMSERTEEWTSKHLTTSQFEKLQQQGVSVFAPILRVPYPMQWQYLNHLADDQIDRLSGLAFHGLDIMSDLLENYEPLHHLARLSLDGPKTPHDVLKQIAAGIDVCTVPFLNTASDTGLALTCKFPAPATHDATSEQVTSQLPLGINVYAPEHATSVAPLVEGCACYTCTKHHRAFIHHLLNAKEMLGWALLQVHNYHMLSEFFAGIRYTLNSGASSSSASAEEDVESGFEKEMKRFMELYEEGFPESTGHKPRARGYHFRNEAHQKKINERAWGHLGLVNNKNGSEGGSPGDAVLG